VSGVDGLGHIRDLLAGADAFLQPGGLLALEVDSTRADASLELAREQGWSDARVELDLFGLPRYLPPGNEGAFVIPEKAVELGRLIGQSPEYKALKRAQDQIGGAPELRDRLERLRSLAETIERGAQQGVEPTQVQMDEYDKLLSTIQTDSTYQGMVSAQSNFDKLMMRVNEQMMDGMRKGAASPIITLG
jgi:cell fate (sporulation/competence/biofilm development) regulator YlbF (YheA/YmcA/DUF963 family)